MRGWTDIGSDVNWEDYGGNWAKADPNVAGVWWVISFTNMYDACGESVPYKYVACVRRIDLGEVPQSELESAYECCGMDPDEYPEAIHKVYVLSTYGVYAPMDDFTGNSYPARVRAAARRFADECIADNAKTSDLLDRTVNKIGSTARDFQRGDCLAGLARYASGEGPQDDTKDLMLKIHGGIRIG